MFHTILLVLAFVTIAFAKVNIPTRLLNDGNKIPALSFGTFGKVSDVDEFVTPAVIKAIESGYRQIDTASVYANEENVGEAIADVIRREIVTREEIFICTKLAVKVGTREGVLPAILEALERLQLDYIDLFIIHVPYNLLNISDYDYVNIWKGMEDVNRLKLARSIGVSNFKIGHLKELVANSKIVPAVNEIEVHPSFTNTELVNYCHSLNITVLAYAPFGFMVPRPFAYNPTTISFEEPLLVDIARKYGKKTSQIVIRYLIDRGTIPIPKSQNQQHIKSNAEVFDFCLTAEEVTAIGALNENAKAYNLNCPSGARAIVHYFEL